MNILALDFGQHMGWATRYGGKIKSGTVNFSNGQFDGAGVRYLKFSQWLATHDYLDLVFYEGVRSHNGIDAAHIYGGWMAIVQAYCEKYNIPYAADHVKTIKKFWTGKGNADKDKMIHVAREKGFNPKDDNEADALAVLHLAVHVFDKLL